MKTLRTDQAAAIDNLREAMSGPNRTYRVVLGAPTGFGKTVVAADIVHRVRKRDKRVIITVPAISLIDQTVEAFYTQGIDDIGVIQADHGMTNAAKSVQVASVQSLMRREIPRADLVLIDECFAAGTLIDTPDGRVPIERLQSGMAVYNATGLGFIQAVVKQYKRTRRVTLSNGEVFNVTRDHPFFTERGWQELEARTVLFSREALRKLWSRVSSDDASKWRPAGRVDVDQAEILLGFLREETYEPGIAPGNQAEAIAQDDRNWAPTEDAGRQREAVAIGAGGIVEGIRGRLDCRVRGADEDGARERISNLLQDRYRKSRDADWHRGRWARPCWDKTGAGQEEGRSLGDVWVESISSDESSCLEPVYNLRVSGHPSYFASGVLAHNCHKWFSFFEKWFADAAWRKVPFIGMSATPWTKGLGVYFDKLVAGNTVKQMIAEKTLAPFRVYAAGHPDLEGVRTSRGAYGETDFVEVDLVERMNRPKLVADAVQSWLELAEGRPTICFAVNRDHAAALAKQFNEAGVGAGYLDCETKASDWVDKEGVLHEGRRTVRRKFLDGEYRIVCNVDIIGVGVDWPEVSCISYCRPTRSEMRYCLDHETEVLTSGGWRGMGQVREGDCVATMADLGSGIGRWSRVLGVIERDMVEEEAWVEYHSPLTDFRVTDQHRMIFAERETFRRRGHIDAAYRIAPAKEMLKPNASYRMPTAVEMAQPGVPLSDAELYFIGMMMTDGTWGARSGGISQSERYPEIIGRIERCLSECGIAYSKRRIPVPTSLHSGTYVERHARWQYSLSFGKPIEGLAKPRRTADHLHLVKHGYERIPGRTGFAHLLPFLDKNLAPALMALSKTQFFVLLQGIHDGDGHKMKSPSVDWTPRSWTLCSARKLFIERLQALAAINGCTGHLHPEPRGKNPLYVLTISPKNWRSVGGNRPKLTSKPATAERVWCVETETGTVVTRRRGKVTVVGNCQNIGRGLRIAPGKTDLIVIDHSDSTLRLGFVSDITRDELDDGQPKINGTKPVELPKECPKCHYLKPPRTAKCPACGHVNEHQAKPIYHERGTLREISPADINRPPPAAKKFPNRAETYGMLMWYQKKHSRKDKWAVANYKQLYGVWPREASIGGWQQHFKAPNMDLASWIKSRQIAYAKSKNNGQRWRDGGGVQEAPRAFMTAQDYEDFR